MASRSSVGVAEGCDLFQHQNQRSASDQPHATLWCAKVKLNVNVTPQSVAHRHHSAKWLAMLTTLKQEGFLLLALIAACVAYPLEHWMLHSGQVIALISGLALIAFIVAA